MFSELFTAFGLIFLLLLATALAVATEFAVVSVDKEQIREIASSRKNNYRSLAQRLLPHLKDNSTLDHCASACQIVITLASLIIGSIGEMYLAKFLIEPLNYVVSSPETVAHIASVVIVIAFTIIQVLFGELLPKSIATRYTEKAALFLVRPLDITIKCTNLFIKFLNGSGILVLKLFGVKPQEEHSHARSLKELIYMVGMSAESGVIDREDQDRLTSALRFSQLKVGNVFNHNEADEELYFGVRLRADEKQAENKLHRLIRANLDDSMDKVLKIFDESPYSRLLIFGKGEDSKSVVGLVHIKDLSFAIAKGLLEEALRKSGHKYLKDLSLEEFDSIYADIDNEVQKNIELDREKRIEEIEKSTDLETDSRKKHREIHKIEEETHKRLSSEILFQHGFIKRDLFVDCDLDDELGDVEEELNSSYASLAVVKDKEQNVLGILTMEDILEVRLGSNIDDETDLALKKKKLVSLKKTKMAGL
ncbi:DUF21 domain-containing protein [bacterium]|nr:DUF21 domain-containing protein [bacterium]